MVNLGLVPACALASVIWARLAALDARCSNALPRPLPFPLIALLLVLLVPACWLSGPSNASATPSPFVPALAAVGAVAVVVLQSLMVLTTTLAAGGRHLLHLCNPTSCRTCRA